MLSVLVPAARFTGLLLDSLSALQPSKWPGDAEVIIGLDSSDQNAHAERLIRAAPAWAKVVNLGASEPLGPATIRNRLAAIASGDYLLFIDSDVLLSDSVLRVFAGRVFALDEFTVTTVRISPIVINHVSLFFSHEVFLPRSVAGHCYFPSAFIGMHRELWLKVGGFDGSFPVAGGEDWEWWQRAHTLTPPVRPLLMADLSIAHENPTSLAQLIRRAWRYGLQAHRYHSKRDPRWGLADRALGLLLIEVVIPFNRALARAEGSARRSFGQRFGYPLASLKNLVKYLLRFRNKAQPTVPESKHPFLLAERLVFRLEARGLRNGINRLDSDPPPSTPANLGARVAKLMLMEEQELREVTLRPGEHFGPGPSARHTHIFRALKGFWRLNHRTAAGLGPLWHKIVG